MAVILATAGFWAPCTYAVPGDDLKPLEIKFRARWKRMTRPERKELDRRLQAARTVRQIDSGIPTSLSAAEVEQQRQLAISDEQFLNELLIDWDLKDARGNPVPYSPTARNETCDQNDGLEPALVSSYFMALQALNTPKATEKNSDMLSGTTS